MQTKLTIESIFKQIDQLKEDIDKDYQEFQERQQSKKKLNKIVQFFNRLLNWFKAALA